MCDYKIEDIEAINKKFDDHLLTEFNNTVESKDVTKYAPFLHDVLSSQLSSICLKAQHKIFIKNSYLLKIAKFMQKNNELTNKDLEVLQERFRIKRGRSSSGVLVVTIFTAPYPSFTDSEGIFHQQKFSCKWNCYYCPNEPGQPRSYLKGEPGVLRANRYEFDCCRQMWGRMEQLLDIGHTIDKLEVIVLGGTWASYPHEYQEEFLRDMYYSANTFWDIERREKLGIEDEKRINRTATSKVIGLTLETRPDTINVEEIMRFRKYGCTRVQLGIQHLDDAILKKINRRCTYKQTIEAIALLKDWGYKVDGHFMPNLPGATPDLDDKMFKTLLNHTMCNVTVSAHMAPITKWTIYNIENEDIQIDQWKIYPCEVVPWTVIEKWYKAGEYMPYPEIHLAKIILDAKRNVFPWIRLNRIVRDIPSDYIMASGDHPNMRQDIQTAMKKCGYTCKCIRCREVKLDKISEERIYIARQYNGSNGIELFISCESPDEATIYGFVRLRIPEPSSSSSPFFTNHAWIRELHVYGKVQTTTKNNIRGADTPNATQHKGIGSTLMEVAETVGISFGKSSMYVIAGEGTKSYYERLGYRDAPYGYMHKSLKTNDTISPCASMDTCQS